MKLAYPKISFDKDSKVFVTFYINKKRYRLYNGDRIGIIFKKTRFYASWGIILLLIAVYPANIYLAFSEDAQQAIGVSSFFASWVRLPIQFVLIGLAFYSSKT